MRVLIRKQETKQGATSYADRMIDAGTVKVGRGTDQDIQIPDPRVALEHAVIDLAQGGPYRVQSRQTNGVWVNGRPCPASMLDIGDSIDLGRFRLTVIKPELGTDLALLLEEKVSAKAQQQEERQAQQMALTDTGLSKRGLAWAGFVLILVTMLLFPLASRYASTDAVAEVTPAAVSDQVWLSGEVSGVHAYFEDDCGACHVEPFKPVQNDACLACHDQVRQHIDVPEFLSMPEFAAADCTDCHREHNGESGTIVRDAAQCTDCHAKPSDQFAGTALKSVRDFSTSHPPFAPQVATYKAEDKRFEWKATPQGGSEPLREEINLIFPHDLHLDEQGVDAPEGTRVMECADCHVADRGDISFAPVDMQAHCADCHRLEFDPDNPQRIVPHGQPAEVAGVLRDYFAAKALSGNVKELGTLPAAPARRRPGPQREIIEQKQAVASWSAAQGELAVREVFEGRLCRYCHLVEETGDQRLPWDIAPLALEEHAMRRSWFDHGAHEMQPCSDCHAAESSSQGEDVLLPEIAVCKDCHGDEAGKAQVASACVDCHVYHEHSTPLWDIEASQRKFEAAHAQPSAGEQAP